jgi:asparagine synthase (glutamine-hydrolysing)
MTMAASLEARCPLLDYRIVNFGLGLPDNWKIRGRTTKLLLRRVARTLLPTDLADRPKHTFRVPLSHWLRGPLKQLVREAVSSDRLSILGIVDQAGVAKVADDHLQGRADFSRALWALITLYLWFLKASEHASLEGAR